MVPAHRNLNVKLKEFYCPLKHDLKTKFDKKLGNDYKVDCSTGGTREVQGHFCVI